MATSINVVPENVISRLRKLLGTAQYSTKGDGTITEAEATLAAERAQKLMAEWNIEAATIEAMGDPTRVVEEKRVKEHHDRSAMYKYQQRLWATVCHVNFTIHFTVPVYKDIQVPDPDELKYCYTEEERKECRKIWINKLVNRKHYIVGKESNVIASRTMGDYLEDVINSLCPYKVTNKKALSWKEGCVERVRARLLDRKRDLEEQHSAQKVNGSTTALALRDVFQSEYDKNIDAEYGEGTSSRRREAQRQREEEREAEDERRQMVLDCPKVFSKEEYKEAVEYVSRLRHNREKWARQSERESDRYWKDKDISAWYEGRKAGDKIGLDAQIGSSSTRMIEE